MKDRVLFFISRVGLVRNILSASYVLEFNHHLGVPTVSSMNPSTADPESLTVRSHAIAEMAINTFGGFFPRSVVADQTIHTSVIH